MKSRRCILATAVSLLVGGCSSNPAETNQSSTPASTTTQRPQPSTDKPDRQQRSPSPTSKSGSQTATPDCTRGYTVYISPFAPTEQIISTFRPAKEPLVERIITDSGVELQTYGQSSVENNQYTRYDEVYYRIDYEQTNTEEVQARPADLSWEKGQKAPENKTVVNYTALPEVDQYALEYLIYGPKYTSEQLPKESLGIRNKPVPYPKGTENSELVGAGTTWVEWNNHVYNVAISANSTTITRRTFNYTAARIADSEEMFREYVADRYLESLEGLSSEEQSVLEAAIKANKGGKYEDCNEPSPGYEKLEQRMENMPDLPNLHAGHWYISYEGEQYLLEISGWVR